MNEAADRITANADYIGIVNALNWLVSIGKIKRRGQPENGCAHCRTAWGIYFACLVLLVIAIETIVW